MVDIVLVVIASSTLIASLAYVTKNISKIKCCFKLCECEQITQKNPVQQNQPNQQNEQNEQPLSPQTGLMELIRNNVATMMQMRATEQKPPIIQLQSQNIQMNNEEEPENNNSNNV